MTRAPGWPGGIAKSWSGESMSDTCAHLEGITSVKHAKKRECEECVKTGTGGSISARARNAV
jgi:hypothetical protein